MERKEKMKKTIKYLDMAMARNDLRETVEDAYPLLQQYLRRGDSILFPELVEAGQSIVHGDLQTLNIGCNNVSDNNDWTIKFIDWEGASFAPCWFDMVNLVGVFLAYRSDWRAEEAQIVSRCVDLYASEMLAQGISFRTEPLKLYKMAYVQRIVEKSLEMQLSWKLSGRSKGNILAGSIEKLTSWGRELGLM